MRLTRDIDHWSFRQANYYIGTEQFIFQIDYSEAINTYDVAINQEHLFSCNTYREAQIACEAYLEWVIDTRLIVKQLLYNFIEAND